MIMNSLKNNPILNSESVQSISPMGYNMRGRGMSDRDMNMRGSGMSDVDTQEAANAAIAYQMALR
jgi:hypothetical protein